MKHTMLLASLFYAPHTYHKQLKPIFVMLMHHGRKEALKKRKQNAAMVLTKERTAKGSN